MLKNAHAKPVIPDNDDTQTRLVHTGFLVLLLYKLCIYIYIWFTCSINFFSRDTCAPSTGRKCYFPCMHTRTPAGCMTHGYMFTHVSQTVLLCFLCITSTSLRWTENIWTPRLLFWRTALQFRHIRFTRKLWVCVPAVQHGCRSGVLLIVLTFFKPGNVGEKHRFVWLFIYLSVNMRNQTFNQIIRANTVFKLMTANPLNVEL